MLNEKQSVDLVWLTLYYMNKEFSIYLLCDYTFQNSTVWFKILVYNYGSGNFKLSKYINTDCNCMMLLK